MLLASGVRGANVGLGAREFAVIWRGATIAKVMQGATSLRAAVAFVLLVMAPTSIGCVVNEPESPPRGVVVSGPPPAPVPETHVKNWRPLSG